MGGAIVTHHRPAPRPVLVAGVLLGTRQAAAALVARHPDQVRRRCAPIACDAASRGLLYDLDQVAAVFARLPRRQSATRRAANRCLTATQRLVHPMAQ